MLKRAEYKNDLVRCTIHAYYMCAECNKIQLVLCSDATGMLCTSIQDNYVTDSFEAHGFDVPTSMCDQYFIAQPYKFTLN